MSVCGFITSNVGFIVVFAGIILESWRMWLLHNWLKNPDHRNFMNSIEFNSLKFFPGPIVIFFGVILIVLGAAIGW